MRVLFDQATPLPIHDYLDQHSVSTASQLGWDRLKNGDRKDSLAKRRPLMCSGRRIDGGT